MGGRLRRGGHRREDRVAQRVDRAADEPRYVHLRDPDLVGDLTLGQPFEEPQVEDLALARGQLVEAAAQRQALLGALEAQVVLADRLEGADAVGQRLVERHHAIGLARAERLDDLVDGRLRAGGELVDRGRAPEVTGERLARARQPRTAWGGDSRQTARSALFRLPSEPDARPLVAMVGLEGEGERVARVALAELEREAEGLRHRDERHTRWLDALALLAEEFRREPGRVAVDNGLDVILRHTNALDAAIAYYVSGQLVVPSSRRGLLESSPITVSAHPELARCLRDADPTWLDAAASAALGVPPDLHASAMPIVVAGESLGVVVFVFADVEPHDEDNRRLLTAVSAAMGFALLRDRLAQELREAAGAPG
jgi:hypothetical protein